MTLDEILLPKLAEWHPAGTGRHTWALAEESVGWAIALTAERCDAYSCLAWELSIRRTTAPVAPDHSLKGWADRVAEQIGGLLKPLTVVEVDAQRNEALLRSDVPITRGEKLVYDEILLRGMNEAILRRYQHGQQVGQRREQVGFALTHDAVARLVSNLIA